MNRIFLPYPILALGSVVSQSPQIISHRIIGWLISSPQIFSHLPWQVSLWAVVSRLGGISRRHFDTVWATYLRFRRPGRSRRFPETARAVPGTLLGVPGTHDGRAQRVHGCPW